MQGTTPQLHVSVPLNQAGGVYRGSEGPRDLVRRMISVVLCRGQIREGPFQKRLGPVHGPRALERVIADGQGTAQ